MSNQFKRVEDELPEEGKLCDILLERSRVVEQLKRHGRLWWTSDDKMYVYYTPTHWKYADDNNRD